MPEAASSTPPAGGRDEAPAGAGDQAKPRAWFSCVVDRLGGKNPDSVWLACLFALLALTTTALVLGYETETGRAWFYRPQWSKRTFDSVMYVGSGIGLATLVGFALLRRFPWFQRVRRARWWGVTSKLLVALLVFAMGLNYFYARRAASSHWVHFHDTYHYTLGPKYYDEYGYFWHYKCTLEAAPARAIPNKSVVRDLRNYEFTTAGKIREPRRCEAMFSPERWEEYKRDIELYAKYDIRGPIHDLGYNGTPLHAVIAGSLVNRFELSYATLAGLGLIDVYLICVMLFFVARSFGWRLGLAFALVIFTAVVDRYGVIGGSVLRWSWWFALGLGIVALKDQRWSLAGFWLVAAAMLNVFPLLFLFGACVALLGECVRARALLPSARRFVVAALVSTLALGVLSVSHARGLGNYRDFFEDMRVHEDGPPVEGTRGKVRHEKYPGYGVGLKFIFMYRGKHHDKSKSFSRARLTEEFREIKPLVQALGLALTGFAALLCLRLRPFEAAILFGFTAFYGLLGTVHYYFACASLLVLLWYRRVAAPGGMLLLIGYFACNTLAHAYLHHVGSTRVLYNTLLSSLWLVYLVAVLVYLSRETGWGARLASLLAASAPAAEPTLEPASSPATDPAPDPAPDPATDPATAFADAPASER